MLMSLGSWALRGYGMWACEKIDGEVFIGSVGVFCPLDWPEPEIAYSLDQPFWARALLPKRRGWRATGCSSTFRWIGQQALFVPTISRQNGSSNVSVPCASERSSCEAVPTNNWVHYRPAKD